MERLGNEYVFGMPGAHILPVYDSLYDSMIKSVLVKHEQGAAFMAGGYARASGKISACITTAGPGATNLVKGIANAYAEKQPILIIIGMGKKFAQGMRTQGYRWRYRAGNLLCRRYQAQCFRQTQICDQQAQRPPRHSTTELNFSNQVNEYPLMGITQVSQVIRKICEVITRPQLDVVVEMTVDTDQHTATAILCIGQ